MAPQPRDYVTRTKKPSPLGTTAFICSRLLGPIIAYYYVLGQGSDANWIINPPVVSDKKEAILSLSPSQWVIFLMGWASTIKHIYWVLFISEQELPLSTGIFFGGLESLTDILNSWIFMHYFRLPFFSLSSSSSSSDLQNSASPSASSYVLKRPILPGLGSLHIILGILLFDLGLTIETASELQRRAFKRDPRNAGKPFSRGLFGLARNINYGGHVLWKMGNALAAGGWLWALLVGGFYFYDFMTRGVPVLDAYCETKVCKIPFFFLSFFFLRLLSFPLFSFPFPSLSLCLCPKKDAKTYFPHSSIFTLSTHILFFCFVFGNK